MSARAGVAALACALGLAGCTERPKPAGGHGPLLSIFAPVEAPPTRPLLGGRPVALALGGLAPDAIPRLRQHLADSQDEAARRAAPEVFDLADEAGASGPLRSSLPELPGLTAAASLLGAPWEASGISVHIGTACEVAATRCAPLFATNVDPADDLVRRGRALAWAAGNAGLLRSPSTSRGALIASLREAQRRPSSTIALLFDAARGTLDEAELAGLRGQAARLLEELGPGAPQRTWLAAVAGAPASWELPFALDADDVLVIPRLSVLARLDDFASEIERAGTFEWVARPGGARTKP